MAHSWDQLGEIASVAQLTGVDAVKLIGMIVTAANTARMHKKNCRQFAQHLKLIGNLLEQLKISEMKKTRPEVQEPLEGLEDALRRSYLLVNSCQDKSYLYLLAMGCNIVYQFRKAQDEIDRYLKIIPLITLVDNVRVRVSQCFIKKNFTPQTIQIFIKSSFIKSSITSKIILSNHFIKFSITPQSSIGPKIFIVTFFFLLLLTLSEN